MKTPLKCFNPKNDFHTKINKYFNAILCFCVSRCILVARFPHKHLNGSLLLDAKKENPVIFICMQKLRDRGTSFFYTIADFLTTDSENPNSVLFKSFF